MTPSFSQVFFADEAVLSALLRVKEATSRWIKSSTKTEAVLLNEVSDALLAVASNNCRSQIYPTLEVSASRTILDRKGMNNRDLFGADLAVTLSLYEDEQLIKQRTALFQLKVGKREGSKVQYSLDVRQIYTVGHNKHSLGRWFMTVCDNHGIWNLAAERLVAEYLSEKELTKVPFPQKADRDVTLQVGESWSSIAQWTLDWLAGAQGEDSDLSDSKRLETVLSELRKKEEELGELWSTTEEFENQFNQYGILLPRVHIEYSAVSKRKN